MKKLCCTVLPASFAVLLLIPFLSFSPVYDPDHSPPRWEKLGERQVNILLDRDEILAGLIDGFFDALKIKVKKGFINMHRMAVHFNNGEVTEFELRNTFRPGSESRILDLPGNKRIISKVVFWYDTRGFAGRKAVVELWGRH